MVSVIHTRFNKITDENFRASASQKDQFFLQIVLKNLKKIVMSDFGRPCVLPISFLAPLICKKREKKLTGERVDAIGRDLACSKALLLVLVLARGDGLIPARLGKGVEICLLCRAEFVQQSRRRVDLDKCINPTSTVFCCNFANFITCRIPSCGIAPVSISSSSSSTSFPASIDAT